MHENARDFWCIAEDIAMPDMEKRRGPKSERGITEGEERRIINLTEGSEKPLGEWKVMTIECVKNTVKVWLNGVLVSEATNWTA